MLRPFITSGAGVIALAMACLAGQVQAAEAGKVVYVAGSTQVADKAGAEGVRVQEGELLSTGKDGYLYVKTIDNGLLILRPNTQARIVAYKIDAKNPANTRIKLELIRGVARSKSGDAVKLARQNFRFNTPVAAIGVRGTDFTVYTDQEESRVAVLTGGVVVSGFADGCSPEGIGPCEGAASRELMAAQRGQLLQVRRGVSAPQLLEANGNGPDQVSPPRADEAVVKVEGSSAPILDARKSDTLDKIVSQTPQPPGTGGTAPQEPPVVVVPEPDLPVEPQQPSVPERGLQWGRWVALAGHPATIGVTTPAGGERLLGTDYVLFRTAGRDYVAPERGSASFVLKDGEATIRAPGAGGAVTVASLQNGVLAFDFGKRSFVTSFDVVNGTEVLQMKADGTLNSSGRFGNSSSDVWLRPQANNMRVDGFLSNENGGSAAYLFSRTLDDQRTVNGVTVWAK